MIKFISATIFLSLLSLVCLSQEYRDSVEWNRIENAIKTKTYLKVSRNRIEQLKPEIWKARDYPALARFYYYQMRIDDLRTEDSLYFKNSAFIDSLLEDNHSPAALKPLLHLMQAKRLAVFAGNRHSFNRKRYANKRFNYSELNERKLDSVIRYHFSEAKKTAINYTYSAEDILWISSDPFSFFFSPNLIDIVITDELKYLDGVEHYGRFYDVTKWMKLSPDDFIRAVDTMQYEWSAPFNSLHLYSQWWKLHRNEKRIYYCIEQLARKFVNNNTITSYADKYDEGQELYEQYLQQRTNSSFTEVKALAIQELCKLWTERGTLYSPETENYYGEHHRDKWDTAYQYLPAKALQLYEDNIQLFELYPRLQTDLRYLKNRILSKELTLRIDDVNPPATSLLVKLQYKNVSRIYYRLVRLNNGVVVPEEGTLKYLLSKNVIREKDEVLPIPADHNEHRTFLKVDPLLTGNYYMLFADHPIHADDTLVSYRSFDVSSIAVLSDAKRIYILDRKSGQPLRGANVVTQYSEVGKAGFRNSHYQVNQQGYFDISSEGNYLLNISYRGDTFVCNQPVRNDKLPAEVFNKDEGDDILEFYSGHTTVQILTDRRIYRPGQKVYYKAIFTTRNPKTGEPVVINKQNMRQGWFKNYLKKWRDEEEPKLYIKDPFNRIMDSLKVIPNEYGSVTGTFLIPKVASTGEWNIEPDVIDIDDHNNGEFNVEEYKRPTYELTVDKPVKTINLNDTIYFTIHARSFAGVNLNDIPIAYKVKRHTGYSAIDEDGFFPSTDEVVDSTGYTDAKGELVVKVYDTAQQRLLINEDIKVVFNYQLDADAIDATGEAQSVKKILHVSNRPVNIGMWVGGSYNVNYLRPLLITAKDENRLDLVKDLTVNVYKSALPEKKYETDLSLFADQFVYSKEDLQLSFPQTRFFSDTSNTKELLVYTTTIHTANGEKLHLPKELLTSASYKIFVTCTENGKITGKNTAEFTLFDNLNPNAPSFFYLLDQRLKSGDTLVFFSGSNYDSTYVVQQIKYYSMKNGQLRSNVVYAMQNKEAGVTSFKWKVPENAKGEIILSQVFIANNIVHHYTNHITVFPYKDKPQIIIEQFRRTLAPGATTTFTVSVKTKVKNVASELMSVMYDASLDKLERHNWELPDLKVRGSLDNSWGRLITRVVSKEYFFQAYVLNIDNPLMALQGRIPGLSISSASELGDGKGMAYETTSRRISVGSISRRSGTIRMQDIQSVIGNDHPLIFLDSVPFAGLLSSINLGELTEGLMLRGTDATEIYGSKGIGGVLLLSTKGSIVLPEVKPEAPVKVRRNFNETAFFLPAVYADKDGYYHIPFTIPESTTAWNWKLYAHTKDAQFAYAEKKLTTVLPLIVQPNMPRLFYQGDKMVLQTRISNLEDADMKGSISCKVEDEETGEDITNVVVSKTGNTFAVNAKSNIVFPFTLAIPASLLHAIKITVTAQTNNFSDAEEHIIPVLSKKLLIKESLPLRFQKTDTVINIPFADGELYGVGLSMNPLPQAAIINALPFLSAYSFNCAEQTFNKLLAHSIAIKLMHDNKDMQKMFLLNKEKNEKDSVQESQTTPWLDLTNRIKKQQKELFNLLDEDRSAQKIDLYFKRLWDLQKGNGGLSWFDKGESDPYISAYVLTGFGKLREDSIKISSSRYENFIKDLVRYCDTIFIQRKKGDENLLIARSYWMDKFPLSDTMKRKINIVLKDEWKKIDEKNLQQKARLIIATRRFSPDDKKAMAALESLQQLAIRDDMGWRWKDIADADDLQTNGEETLALLAEAFEGPQFTEVRAGILQWLLNTQSEHHWQTTKATAAAIKLLNTEKQSFEGTAQIMYAFAGDSKIPVSNDVLGGNLFSFVKMSKIPATVSLKKPNEGTVTGDFTAYYFRDWDKVNQTGSHVNLTRELLYQEGADWKPINKEIPLKVGDKVRVVLHIVSDKPLRYVYIDDKRAAAFEPEDVTSGNEYGVSFSYYRSVHDEGCQLFSSFLPSGENIITYNMTVAHEGQFSCGPASLECMYRPDVHAYSSPLQIKTIKK